MNWDKRFSRWLSAAGFMVGASVTVNALGAGVEPVRSLARQENPALIETLRDLVAIESGSTDLEGLDQLARRRVPLEATRASRALAGHAQQIYRELGRELVVDDKPEGGGTDAAFAALRTTAPVIERFGLQGFGAHSAEAEYILLDSLEPRLYLLARLIMDVSRGTIP